MTEIGQAPVVHRSSYDAIGPLGDSRIQSIPAGSNLLIAGPTMTGKRDLAYQTLRDGFDDGNEVVAVLSNDPPTEVVEYFNGSPGTTERPLHVVDCTGRETTQPVPHWLRVSRVSSPGDLTGIGIGIAKSMNEIGTGAEDGLYLGISSLSTLLQYADPRRVFNFTHVMTGRIAAGGYLGTWTLDSDAHEPATVNTLKGLFKYVAEVREQENGRRALRVLGGPPEWRSWDPID